MPLTSHGRRALGPDAPDPLTERLGAINHRWLNLDADGKGGPHRPVLSIWPAADEDQPPAVVTVYIGPMIGQQARYLDMTIGEARTLARHLTDMADVLEREVAAVGQMVEAAE